MLRTPKIGKKGYFYCSLQDAGHDSHEDAMNMITSKPVVERNNIMEGRLILYMQYEIVLKYLWPYLN